MSFQENNNFFGLDISERSLRLIQLKKSGNKTIIVTHNQMSLPEKIVVDGEIKEINKMAEAIKTLIKTANGAKIRTKNVISVLPEAKTFIKVIQLDKLSSAESKVDIEEQIKNEIEKHFPLDIEDIYLDWQIINETRSSTTLLIGAVPKNISDSYTKAIEASGFSPLILEIEAAPIIRSLVNKEDNAPKVIIDFGASRSGLIIYDHSTVPFTISLPTSGEKITQTISKTLNIDAEKSENVKLVCGLDKEKCEGALRKVLFESITDLANSIKKNILYYQNNFPESGKITEIVLCGGGANFIKINEVLQEKIGLPVKIGDPLTNNIKNKKNGIPMENLLSYTTAIGLALRGSQKNKQL